MGAAPEARRLFLAQIVLGLEALHSKDIIYRDLKLQNLMIGADGYIKFIDFGFSKRLKDRTFTPCGTAAYLAPEILAKVGYSYPVDVWALGILICEMVGGSPFYDHDEKVML